MKKLIFIFFLGIALISCSSNDETNETTDDDIEIENPSIIGNWNWTITEGGISGVDQMTPESFGKDIQLNLNEDSSYSLLENGVEISNGDYTIILASSIYSDMDNFISYSENIEDNGSVVYKGVIRNQDSSHLTISDNYNDGFTSHFEKIE